MEKVYLLIIGFLLSSILGGFWAFLLKRKSWEEETLHALHQAKYDEGVKFLDSLSKQVGNRFFLLQRLFWAIEANDNERIQRCEADYFDAVKEWNTSFWSNRNNIRLLVGEKQADYFLDYKDYAAPKPKSLHYKFVEAHGPVMRAKQDPNKAVPANQLVTELNWKCSVFLERLTSEFAERAAKLKLLEVPSGPGSAEQSAPADARSSRG